MYEKCYHLCARAPCSTTFPRCPQGLKRPIKRFRLLFDWYRQGPDHQFPEKGHVVAQAQRQSGTGSQAPGRADPWFSLLPTSAHDDSPVRVCEREGEDTHAPEFKFQFSLWDLDVNLLGVKSSRGCNLLN